MPRVDDARNFEPNRGSIRGILGVEIDFFSPALMDPWLGGHVPESGPMLSFKHLYREHYGFVWATVRRHGVTPMLVEDAVHDTFVVAYRRLDAFDGRRPRAWLYSIGRRVASSYRRTEGRRDARHQVVADTPRTPVDLETSVTAKTALDRFIEGLSPEDRELFVLSEVDGLSGPELASTLGRKLPTLYSRIRILRQRFEQSVGGDVREERPQASAHGWLLLQPWLTAPAVAGGSMLIAGALVAGVVGLTVIGIDHARPSAPPTVDSLPRPTVPAAEGPTPPPPAAVAPPPLITDTPPPSPPPDPVKPRARPRPVAPAPAPIPDLAADTRLLREAKAALNEGDPRRAQTLLQEHERTFSQPAQPDLRTAVWIETLCALGREDDARAKARALLTARPSTPLAGRIRDSCVGQP